MRLMSDKSFKNCQMNLKFLTRTICSKLIIIILSFRHVYNYFNHHHRFYVRYRSKTLKGAVNDEIKAQNIFPYVKRKARKINHVSLLGNSHPIKMSLDTPTMPCSAC